MGARQLFRTVGHYAQPASLAVHQHVDFARGQLRCLARHQALLRCVAGITN